MKLQIFNKTNTGSTKSSVPMLTVRLSGCISFNEPLIKLLDLKDEDGIMFAQSEEDPIDWYVFKSKDPEAFRFRKFEKTGWAIVQNVVIAKKIIVSLDHSTTIKVLVTIQPIKNERLNMHLLIASTIIPVKRKQSE